MIYYTRVELGIPGFILNLIDGVNGEIEDGDYDGELIISEEIADEDIEPQYYDVTFHFDGFQITLDAVSNYHLTKIN